MFKYLMILMLVATGLQASSVDLWKQYAVLKGNTFSSLTMTADNHLKISEVAKKLERADIVAWNLNNAAYALINQFKLETDYDNNISAIANAPKAKRVGLRQEFKVLLLSHNDTITMANGFLADARATGFDGEEFLVKVSSNQSFIDWVLKFQSSKES